MERIWEPEEICPLILILTDHDKKRITIIIINFAFTSAKGRNNTENGTVKVESATAKSDGI